MNLLSLPKLSTKRLEALNKEGVSSAYDLLNFFPRRYLDRSNIQRISFLAGQGEQVTVAGKVVKKDTAGYGRSKRLEVYLNDGTGILKGVWFRGVQYFKKALKEGDSLAFFGEVKRYGKHLSIAHPEVDKISEDSELDAFAGIIPIYPGSKALSSARISSKLIREWISILLEKMNPDEFIPQSILNKMNLPHRADAYRMIHVPENHREHQQALERFKFEELFLFQLSMEKIHHRVKERKRGHLFKKAGRLTKTFFNDVIPFELTEGQKKALSDIKKDVRSGKQMNRLIQGDVGAGKTIVAIGAMLMALDNGYQAAFLAPTEILAEQHFRTLSSYLSKLDVNIRLLVGAQKTALRTDVLTDIERGSCQIVVGTHAIIQNEVRFKSLGIAIIDEQHRFGVKQRAELLNKGDHPHVLVMSATPIPRSLALTIYGDLDVSIIQGLPAGRKPVKTAVRSDKDRDSVFGFVKSELEQGGQAYVVYPLVEESEALDLNDATAGFEKLKKYFNDYTVGLLHGKMKSKEKDRIMRSFMDNEIQVLVATTVIEVGVDVPNASIMVIEHAERFGLSQLHQLRGRIGRGTRQSYCILMRGQKLSNSARFRLKTMTETTDGFKIAEADLKLRGPGDFLGTKQSGLPDFEVADIVEDQLLLIQAKEEAHHVLARDPNLENTENQSLRKWFLPYFKEKEQFYGMG